MLIPLDENTYTYTLFLASAILCVHRQIMGGAKNTNRGLNEGWAGIVKARVNYLIISINKG